MRVFIFLLALSTACCISSVRQNPWTANGSLKPQVSRVLLHVATDGDQNISTASHSSENFLIYSCVPCAREYPRVTFTVAESNTEACCRHYGGLRSRDGETAARISLAS